MKKNINTWQKFATHIRAKKSNLLFRLPELKDPVFISGCQRSGTTLLSHIFLENQHFVDFRRGHDSELDGALILSGFHPLPQQTGRYCFQTTYLNERFIDYFNFLDPFKLIFIVRNPFSVVYSMCYHWTRKYQLYNFALNELFVSCADKNVLTPWENIGLKLFGPSAISSIRKASLSYVGKTSQLFTLKKRLYNQILIIDYDDLIQKKESILPIISTFVNLPEESLTTDTIHNKSIHRAAKLSFKEKKMVQQLCWNTYISAKKLSVSC